MERDPPQARYRAALYGGDKLPPGSPSHDSHAEVCPRAIAVVLADRHGMFRQGLASLLSAEPDVLLLAQVADGEAVWQAIRIYEPDVAILDLVLTKASGIEVMRRVDAAALGTRCLILANHEDPSLASQALGAGAAGYVLKDSDLAELMLALRSIDAGGVFVSPSIAIKLRAVRRGGHGSVVLSPRELEVVRLLAAGKSSKEIARALVISPQTVDTHRRRLMKKLQLHSAIEVVCYAAQNRLLA
jgi:DNA-binding NarL/FixJ family response regulator